MLSQVPGYSETFFRNKIKGLQSHGFEVVLFVDQISDSHTWNLTPIYFSPFKGKGLLRKLGAYIGFPFQLFLYSLGSSWRFFQLNYREGIPLKENVKQVVLNQHVLKHSGLDVLHFGFGMLAVGREHLAESKGIPMSVSFRGFDLYLSPLKHPGCYEVLFKKQVMYHVLAQDMKETLLNHGIEGPQIQVITPAIDTEFFKREGDLTPIKQPYRFITVARLHWKKGLEATLEALALLKAYGVSFQYQIIGEGDQFERLVYATHQLGLKKEVQFLGRLSLESVKEALNQADVYLQYSIQEGFCNAVLEAQAMGLLCVVSDAEGLEENVLHGQTGLVVNKRRPDLLAQSLKKLLEREEAYLNDLRTSAIKRVGAEFDLKKQQQLFTTFFESLVN